MRRASLTVHVSTKLNRSHTVTGTRALILPTLGRTDKDIRPGTRGTRSTTRFVTVEDSMGLVHASRGNLTPASPHLLPEPAIVARMARATLGDRTTIDWEEFEQDYATIRDRISRVVPGFENFNTRIAAPGGFALPHAPRDERRFPTTTGKANFTAAPVEYPTLPAGSTAPPDTALPRPVQHHDLRPRRPLPRHQGRSPRRPRQPRRRPRTRPPRRHVRRPRQRMEGRRRTTRPRLPDRALPHRPGLRRRVLPGDQRPGPARRHGRHQQHPHEQIRGDPSGTISPA